MGALTEDIELATALLARAGHRPPGTHDRELARLVGPRGDDIALALQRLGELGLPRDWSPAQGLDARQAETLRKMLLAVVSDPRLVLARLAEQLVGLRHARDSPERARAARGRGARDVRAARQPPRRLAAQVGARGPGVPLPRARRLPAHRGGAQRAARRPRALHRRAVRELRAELRRPASRAEVYGRPKHIYSIYRKMQRKQLAFEQLFDVRAVRVVVASVPDCYAALGVVHGLWPYIPGEFDDYIATPKDNFYRSIHTAVIGPQGKSVEVQIRTREMHEHAELGVAAHWTLQGRRPARRAVRAQDRVGAAASRAAGRAPRGETPSATSSSACAPSCSRTASTPSRPKGEVIDLPRGATPLDFAYSVHTSLGHRCRGAKVNGRIVPLTYTLANGEIVEIITGKQEAPEPRLARPRAGLPRLAAQPRPRCVPGSASRTWATTAAPAAPSPSASCRASARAGEQIAALAQRAQGARRRCTSTSCSARARSPSRSCCRPPARRVRSRRAGRAAAARRRRAAPAPPQLAGRDRRRRRPAGHPSRAAARRCAPQPIAGYVTLGRGVTIHRSDCASLARMRALQARPRAEGRVGGRGHRARYTVEFSVLRLRPARAPRATSPTCWRLSASASMP